MIRMHCERADLASHANGGEKKQAVETATATATAATAVVDMATVAKTLPLPERQVSDKRGRPQLCLCAFVVEELAHGLASTE